MRGPTRAGSMTALAMFQSLSAMPCSVSHASHESKPSGGGSSW